MTRRPPTADDLDTVAAAFDTIRTLTPVPDAARELEPDCRCGHRDDKPWGVKHRPIDPPADLRGLDVDLTTNTLWRHVACLACHHPIGRNAPCVVASGPDYATRLPHYHPQCCVI